MTSRTAPATPAAFRRSLNDRIKQAAKTGHRRPQQLQRQFLLQRLLARVFADPEGPWVLKGGTSLLIRLPGARHSRDIDLLHIDASPDEAVAELQDLSGRDAGDQLRFVLGPATAMTGGVAGVRIPVDVYLGATSFDRFTIDLATDLHTVARLERARPTPVIDMPGLPALPEFVLYPLPDQVADKVCAMYELHGDQQRPSTRYRDLVDLLLITTALSLEAEPTARALASESSRRRMSLPAELIAPGPEWPAGYRAIARDSQLSGDLHDLPQALARAGTCLNPLLAGSVTAGTWSPETARWQL